jgi:hypothetical protein
MSLWFQQQYVDPILNGTKTCTIRTHTRNVPAVGTECEFSVGPRTPFARAVIQSVVPVTAQQLTDDVARADGFANAAAMRDELRRLYPSVRRFVLIRFAVINDA